MNTTMFIPIKLKTSVQVPPTELLDDFNTVILSKLTKTYEGVCSRYGFIKSGSIEIVKRTPGKLMKQHFNGYIQFNVLCKAEVCNPGKDTVVEAKVVNKNALGILAESYIDGGSVPVLDIIVPKKTAGIVSEVDVDNVSIGDNIFVMIIGKRFQLNDTKISIIGRIVRDPKTATQTAVPLPNENIDGDGEAEGEAEGAEDGDAGSESEIYALSDVEGGVDAEDEGEPAAAEDDDENELVGGLLEDDEDDEFGLHDEEEDADESDEDRNDGEDNFE